MSAPYDIKLVLGNAYMKIIHLMSWLKNIYCTLFWAKHYTKHIADMLDILVKEFHCQDESVRRSMGVLPRETSKARDSYTNTTFI